MINIKQTEAAIEAILFASGEPISVKRLADTVEVEEETVYKICKTLQDRKKTDESGICIVELNDSFQMCTNPDFADYIKKALETAKESDAYLFGADEPYSFHRLRWKFWLSLPTISR